MSTSDGGAVEFPSPPPSAVSVDPDPGTLPDLALITRIANEMFAEFPGRIVAAQTAPVEVPEAPALPGSYAALPQPPAPAGVPFTPPTSNFSPGWSPVPEVAPTSAPTISPAPIPAVPSVPPGPAPIGPSAGLPHLPSEAELRLIPAAFGAIGGVSPELGGPGANASVPVAAGIPDLSGITDPVVSAAPPVPTASPIPPSISAAPGLPRAPVEGIAPGSPAPMPASDQFGAVLPTLTGAMGFVTAVPTSPTSADFGHLDLAALGAVTEHPLVAPVDHATPAAAPDLAGLPVAPPVSLGTATATAVDETAAVPGAPAVKPTPTSESFRPDLVAFSSPAARPFDPYAIRRDFPILSERVHGRRLVWLDNAATTQKPQVVIDRLSRFYEHENSNIHRAAHALAARATDAYEGAREKVRRFLSAGSVDEIIFVRGTTEGINLVASTWGTKNIGAGDEILVTHLEHHANIVPWQMLCAHTGAVLKVAPVDDTGQVILSDYQRLIGPRTKLVAFTQVSNALGTVTPSKAMIDIAHRAGAVVMLDAAQSVSHLRADVQALDCDFLVFSGHKVFGPTGIGVVYGKAAILADLPPYQGGGNMIVDVTFERTVYQPAPARFEAGTGNIADAVGLGAALDYLTEVGIDNVAAYEHQLLEYATEGLSTVPGLCLIGTAKEKTSVLSFVLDGYRTEDVGAALDREGIAVRSGHHCAQPILRRFGVEATVRPSLAMYNTHEDVDALVAALHRLRGQAGSYPSA
jgi:cysteine desulfurase / selenocysteine lyase